MNKTLLSTTLLALLSSTTHADNPAMLGKTPTSTLPTPTLAQPATPSVTTTPATPQSIDCKYTIPAQTAHVETSVISTWAGNAAVQSFNFDSTTLDASLNDLKTCYTDQGWQGFNDALEKSGNIKAIKSQHLTVSSQVDGELNINPVKDNQWKVSVPLQVVYQNDKEKLTQLLTVDLLIGRKMSGDLGIMQMIASPRQTGGASQSPNGGPTSTSSEPSTGSSNGATTGASSGASMGNSQAGAQPSTPEPTQDQKPIPASQTQPSGANQP
ncbi:MAG: DotI/IcmL family type IV secretion protein [Legionellales bacterium]|nr:DotI/IcmL family type IV secretion protein [Legionellales bacterium]